jgi:hypothetical protein
MRLLKNMKKIKTGEIIYKKYMARQDTEGRKDLGGGVDGEERRADTKIRAERKK